MSDRTHPADERPDSTFEGPGGPQGAPGDSDPGDPGYEGRALVGDEGAAPESSPEEVLKRRAQR